MYNLVWLLYLSDVVTNISIVLSLLAFVFLVVTVTLTLMMLVNYGGPYTNSKELYNIGKKYWWRYGITCIVLVLIAIGTPSKSTIYAYAAVSEVDLISKTEAAKQIGGEAQSLLLNSLNLLDKKIKEELNPDQSTSK